MEDAAATYPQLRKQVRETLILGQRQQEQARVRTYWETGRLIDEHVLGHQKRSGYRKHVVDRLASDLETSRALLYEVMAFSRAFPIVHTCVQLAWSHYRILLRVPEDGQRLLLARQAGKEGWSVGELEARVRALSANDGDATPRLPEPRRGTPHTYRIVESKTDGVALLDHGFQAYSLLARDLSPGTIVEYDPASGRLEPSERGLGGLYTYEARIEDVVDGDTLHAEIALALGNRTRRVLRLRGVDAPEAHTSQGKKAMRFVEKVFHESPVVLLASSRSDKYDRYLADLFVPSPEGERYLNRELVERGLAVPWRGGS